MTRMEKWIDYEEGSLIPRCRGTPDRIEGSELRDIETPTQNNAIRVLAYTSHKWIVDPDPIKVQPDWHICTHENTWLHKVSWDPLQWTWRDPYLDQGSKVVPFFQFTTRLGHHIPTAQTGRESVVAKVWHTYHVPHTIINKFWQKIWKQQAWWLLIHKSLSVGAWERGNLSSPNCVACPNTTELIRHTMWDCPKTHRIWRGFGRLLQLCQVQGTIK